MPAPISSVQDYFDTLDDRFVSEASKGVEHVYQFEFSGDQGGTWHVEVNDGSMNVHEGAHDAPSAVISTAPEIWVKIINADMTGLRAVITRKMKVSGNTAAARKMQKIFPINSK